MHCACWDKNHITSDHLFLVQERLQCNFLDSTLYFCAGGGVLEAVDNSGIWLGSKDIPELGLSQFAFLVGGGIGIARVNLYRELCVGVNEFGKQREAATKNSHHLFAKESGS